MVGEDSEGGTADYDTQPCRTMIMELADGRNLPVTERRHGDFGDHGTPKRNEFIEGLKGTPQDVFGSRVLKVIEEPD